MLIWKTYYISSPWRYSTSSLRRWVIIVIRHTNFRWNVQSREKVPFYLDHYIVVLSFQCTSPHLTSPQIDSGLCHPLPLHNSRTVHSTLSSPPLFTTRCVCFTPTHPPIVGLCLSVCLSISCAIYRWCQSPGILPSFFFLCTGSIIIYLYTIHAYYTVIKTKTLQFFQTTPPQQQHFNTFMWYMGLFSQHLAICLWPPALHIITFFF